MMESRALQADIRNYMVKTSGWEQRRDYLGISKIGMCPRVAVREYLDGMVESEEAHRMCYAGYEQEHATLMMLFNMGVAKLLTSKRAEVVAPFNERLRGHVDGETKDGDLLEIKSVSRRKFEVIQHSQRVLPGHYVQVQLYMRYGPWKTAMVVYRCRETYEHLVVRVPYSERQASRYEEKAVKMLIHIAAGTLPDCECGKCER